MPATHIRFDNDEWQLVDDDTHEILAVAETAKELEGLEL